MKTIAMGNQVSFKDPVLLESVAFLQEAVLANLHKQFNYAKSNRELILNHLSMKDTRGQAIPTVAHVIQRHLEKQHKLPSSFIHQSLSRASAKKLSKKLRNPRLASKSKKLFWEEPISNKTLSHMSPLKKINNAWINQFLEDMGGLDFPSEDHVQVNRGIEIRLKQVKCVEPTHWEFGDDEIAMGCVFLDAEGQESKKDEFMVRDDFRAGRVKNYSNEKLLKQFKLPFGGTYPKSYLAFIGLAEKDSEGFSDFLDELYTAVRAETQVILTALGAAAGAAIGAAIGGTIGTAIGGPIGTIIGIVAGLILTAIIQWLVSALKDDIFMPQLASITLPTEYATFENNAMSSPYMYLHYHDHGSHYRVKYRWVLKK